MEIVAMPKTDWLTTEQAAEVLDVTVRAVAFMIERGEFPGARKINPEGETSPWIIPLDEVKAYKSKRKPAGSKKD